MYVSRSINVQIIFKRSPRQCRDPDPPIARSSKCPANVPPTGNAPNVSQPLCLETEGFRDTELDGEKESAARRRMLRETLSRFNLCSGL
jgi:hypothetical protein